MEKRKFTYWFVIGKSGISQIYGGSEPPIYNAIQNEFEPTKGDKIKGYSWACARDILPTEVFNALRNDYVQGEVIAIEIEAIFKCERYESIQRTKDKRVEGSKESKFY